MVGPEMTSIAFLNVVRFMRFPNLALCPKNANCCTFGLPRVCVLVSLRVSRWGTGMVEPILGI